MKERKGGKKENLKKKEMKKNCMVNKEIRKMEWKRSVWEIKKYNRLKRTVKERNIFEKEMKK